MEYEKGYVYKLMDNGGPTDVRKDIPANVVAGGAPARVIKELNPSEQKEKW